MLKIRQADKNDAEKIINILKELDLYYPALTPDNFWLAEQGKEIVGTVQLKEYKNFLFLGSLATVKQQRKKGVATILLNEVIKSAQKNIYLYTIIPEFFKRFGFETISPLDNLPPKDKYECEYCRPEKCVTMVKKHAP